MANSWYAVPVVNGIAINNPLGEMIEIYNLDGDCLTSTNERQSEIVLPVGIYMVSGDTISHKVVVKWDWSLIDKKARGHNEPRAFLIQYYVLLTTDTMVLKSCLMEFITIQDIPAI